uniref:GST N-terminal domain-containing protein n=1 Tax=Hanusia phi TaxID=3032 RepID=A0A7S0NFD5_9CRYP
MGCVSSSSAKGVQEPVKPAAVEPKPARLNDAPVKREEAPPAPDKPAETGQEKAEAKEEAKEKAPEQKEEAKEEAPEQQEEAKEKSGTETLPMPSEEVTEHRERPNLVWAKNPMAEGEGQGQGQDGEAPAGGEKLISFNPLLLPVPPAEGSSGIHLYCPLASVEELSGLSILVLLKQNNIPHQLTKESIADPERKMPVYLDDAGLHLWEANAALRYICTKEELTSWYPADLQKRATCDNALEFHGNVLMPLLTKALESYKKGEELAAEAVKEDEEKFLGDVWPAMDHLIQRGEGPLLVETSFPLCSTTSIPPFSPSPLPPFAVPLSNPSFSPFSSPSSSPGCLLIVLH